MGLWTANDTSESHAYYYIACVCDFKISLPAKLPLNPTEYDKAKRVSAMH